MNTEKVKETVDSNKSILESLPDEFYQHTEEFNTDEITLTVLGEDISEGNYIKFRGRQYITICGNTRIQPQNEADGREDVAEVSGLCHKSS